MNKASSLALLAGALAAGLAVVPLSRQPAPDPARSLGNDAKSPVVVEPSTAEPAERAAASEPPQSGTPDSTSIALPLRSIGEVGVSSPPIKDNKDGEPLRLVRELQRQLKRVGCFAQEIDGEWTPATRRAMKDFTDRVKAAVSVERPDSSQLALLQTHAEIVCPEACQGGEGRADNRCRSSLPLAAESKKATTPTAPLQIIWTKSYVTPVTAQPDPADVAEAALPSEAAPRAEPAPRPRRYTSRSTGGGSLFFGLFRW